MFLKEGLSRGGLWVRNLYRERFLVGGDVVRFVFMGEFDGKEDEVIKL